MAKKSYKIPHSIKVTQMDIPINLRSGSVGLKRPITMRVLLTVMLALIGLVFMIITMMQNEFGIISIAITTIGVVIFLAMALTPQKTGLLGYKWFVPTVQYWLNYKNRFIVTRGDARAREVDNLKWQISVESWDENAGVVTHTDGSKEMIFDVIGYGSRALFDDEKERIIDAFEVYLKQLQVGTSIVIIPRQVQQDATIQKESLKELRKESASPVIDTLIARRLGTLENHVEKHFKSNIIRFMVRSKSIEELNTDVHWLRQQGTNGVFRNIRPVVGDEFVDELRARYSLS